MIKTSTNRGAIMINNYIKLPIIKEIEVKNYPLFKKDWNYEFKKGLNLFLGGNTLGKTTSIYIILYGISGIPKEKRDFFIKRIKAKNENVNPLVKLKLKINNSEIELTRNLKNSEITSLSINGKRVKEGVNLNNKYEEEVKSLTKISSLGDYQFLLEKLLIREEEGDYLLWSPNDQAKVLRILFGYEGFDKKFANLEIKVTEHDTEKRGKQDIQAQFKKRLEAIKNQKSDRLKELGELSIEQLEKKVEGLEIETNEIIKKRQSLFRQIEEKRNEKNNLDKENSLIQNQIEEIEGETLKLENKFFESVYSDPKILLAHHKLKNYGICMFCNQKATGEIKRNIVNKIERNVCPVCGLHIPYESDAGVPKEKTELIRRLGIKRKEMSELKSKMESILKSLQIQNEELSTVQEAYFLKEEELKDKLADKDDYKLRLSDLRESRVQDIATYDRDIKSLNKQIEYYQEIINTANKKYEKSLRELKELNKEFEHNIQIIEQTLIENFKAYAGNLFLSCELEIHKEKPVESKIRLPIFLPKIDNVLRRSRDQVSKSEAIYLEYAFRMSLCELYNSLSNNEINLIIETSEGVFDIETVDILGDSLSRFSNKKYYLLLVSNLGRKDFLKYLKTQTKIDGQNILDFFDIGILKGVQKDKLAVYKKVVKEILSNH
jgi:DNA repair exonuclease SbcCD ATPase subunit